MSAVRVNVRGVDELRAGMHKLAGNIADEAEHAFGDVAQSTAGKVRSNVPHRTGRLAGSVEGRSKEGGALVGMGVGVPYARFVEYGGRGFPHSSGNYLTPLATHADHELLAAGESAARKEIGGMSWPRP